MYVYDSYGTEGVYLYRKVGAATVEGGGSWEGGRSRGALNERVEGERWGVIWVKGRRNYKRRVVGIR